MSFDCPSQIRQVYGKLPEVSLRAEVEKALEQPGAEHTASWEAWKHWLVRFSIHVLRPVDSASAEEIRLCQWVAFALRYLQPLVIGNARPQSGDTVMNAINNYPLVISTLLFGSEEECFDILKVAFDPAMLYKEAIISTQRQPILRGVQHRSSDEKTARNWSSALLEPLKVKVAEYFHTVDDQAFREISISVLNEQERSLERPSTAYQAQFERYVALAVAQADRQFYLQALGYANEFNKQMGLAAKYEQDAKRGTVFLVLILASLTMMTIEPPTKLILIGLVMFSGLALFYGRLFNYLRESFAVAQGHLDALETVSTESFMGERSENSI